MGEFGLITFRADDMVASETLPGIRWRYGWIVVDDQGHYELVHDRCVMGAAVDRAAETSRP